MPFAQYYAGVIGHPAGHSLSPKLHRAAAEFLRLNVNYASYDVFPHELENFVFRLRKRERWRGLSVTMPHKRTMVNFVDHTSDVVGYFSLLNTVVIQQSHWKGYNTDISGIVAALKRVALYQAAGAAPPGAVTGKGDARRKQWLVLGAGATACSALKAAQLLGAGKIVFGVRELGRASQVLHYAEAMGLKAQAQQLDAAIIKEASESETIISTLPPLAADGFAIALERAGVGLGGTTVLDVAYNPWPSRLARSAHTLGATVIDGRHMLLFQALEQVRLFFPEETRFYGRDAAKTADFEKHVGHALGLTVE